MYKAALIGVIVLLTTLPAEEKSKSPNKATPDQDKDWLNQGIQDKIKQQETLKQQSAKTAEKPNPYSTTTANASFQTYKPLDLNRASTPWGTVAPKGMYQAQTPYSQASKNSTMGSLREPVPLGQASPTNPSAPQTPSPYPMSGSIPTPSYSMSSPTLSSPTVAVNGLPSVLNTRSTIATSSKDPRLNSPGLTPLNSSLTSSQAPSTLIKPPAYVPPQRASFGPQTKSVSRIEDPWDILNR